MKVPLRFELEGHVSAGYGPIEKQPLTIYLEELLGEMDLPTTYRSVGIFEILCFTDADVELVDY